MLIKGFKLGDFELAYIECMLWSSQNDDMEDSVTDEHSVFDLSVEALQQIVDDCKDFQENNMLVDDAGLDDDGNQCVVPLDIEQCGHDFWLTRNGHGAGFWDRGYDEAGERLTKAAHSYGEQWPYVGDDGLIYLA